MTHYSEPKVNIPHYDVPAGDQILVTTREGTLTYEKQADGGWDVVAYSAAPAKQEFEAA